MAVQAIDSGLRESAVLTVVLNPHAGLEIEAVGERAGSDVEKILPDVTLTSEALSRRSDSVFDEVMTTWSSRKASGSTSKLSSRVWSALTDASFF